MTTAPAAPIQVEAARARWRHDLLMLDAAERRRIAGDDPSPIAATIVADATRKEAQATIHLDVAEAMEAHSIAKIERDADPKDEKAQKRYAVARDALVELRSYWRQIGEATGTRLFAGTVDDFPEPTDEEVLASHGGNV